MAEIEKLPLTSLDIKAHQLERLKEIFPEAFTEGSKVDLDKLRLTLGEAVDTGKERFGMNWSGKGECFKTIQQPSIATLVPVREESVDFDTTQNLFIEGDNLEVLKLLQKSYLGKVKMIYIDPPYNTGKDFIYPDNYSESLDTYLAYTGQVDNDGRKFNTNTETDGRFHSKWMNMMYPRLFLAKNLLRDDGVIFISIDDNEANNLKALGSEIFGEENFISQIIWKNVTDNNPTLVNIEHEYVFVWAKAKENLPESWKSTISEAKEILLQLYAEAKSKKLSLNEIELLVRSFIKDNEEILGFLTRYKFVDEDGIYTGSESVHNPRPGGYDFEVIHPVTKNNMRKPANGYRFPEQTFRDMEKSGVILYGEDENRIVKIKKYLSDYEETLRSVISLDGRLGSYDLKRLFDKDSKIFNNPKPVELLKSWFSFVLDRNDIILDFFSGSCSSADAVLTLNKADNGNRKFICIQIPEPTDEKSEPYKAGYKTIAEIGKERIRRVIQKIKKDRDKDKNLFSGEKPTQDLGFKVFKLQKSNFNIWDAGVEKTPEAIQQQLFSHVDHISPEAEREAILYELLLKSGFEVTTAIEQLTIEGKNVFSIADGELLICLEKQLTHEVIKAMAERKPTRMICLDEGFQNNDQLKTNAVQIMKSKGVVNFRTV